MRVVDWSKFDLSWDTSCIPELVGREFKLKGYGPVKRAGVSKEKSVKAYWVNKKR